MLLHIHNFVQNQGNQSCTPWHSLSAHTRLLSALVMVFAIALTPNGQWTTWVIYGLSVLIVILLSRVSLSRLLSRVAIEFVFIGIVLVETLFQNDGKVIWSWGAVQITTTGLLVLGSVTFKVLLSLLTLNLLVLTTAIPDLFEGLLSLGTSPLLIAIMASMYRYIEVLVRELTTIRRAALSRNLMINPTTTRLITGNTIGSLFIRTYERGELIYQAMLARGYQGLPSNVTPLIYKKQDKLAFVITGIIIFLGQLLYLHQYLY